MKLQKEYCKETQRPFFAPYDGICYSCGKLIKDTDEKHITSCPHCNKSFCD